jgi:MoxR-like ATPase
VGAWAGIARFCERQSARPRAERAACPRENADDQHWPLGYTSQGPCASLPPRRNFDKFERSKESGIHRVSTVGVTSTTPQTNLPKDVELLEACAHACARLKEQVAKAVVGQSETVESMLVALLAQSHALLVGVPGLAKTLLVSSMAQALGLSFGRVQFTPDLLPADITGTDVLSEAEENGVVRRHLRFMRGPIFQNLVLADEINRTPPKTQAALLQAMQEREVTVGGATHALPQPFLVFATRNPIEQEGTYPLPEAQLDRFLLEIHVGYPTEQEENEISRRTTSGVPPVIESVVSAEELRGLLGLVPRIPVTDEAVRLAVRAARASRPDNPEAPKEITQYVRFGAGPRGSQSLVLAAKALAALRGEAAADIEEVRSVFLPALRHRLVLSYRAEADGVKDSDLLAIIERKVM